MAKHPERVSVTFVPALGRVVRQIDVDIDTVSAAGDGLARIGTRTLAVPFTIPGERVRIEVAPSHAAEATLVSVLRPSPHRVTPRCRHFGLESKHGPCGGCTWQHIAYPEQLRLKTSLVDRLVRAAVPQAPRTQPMIPSTTLDQPWGYRHKVHFVFGTSAAARTRRARGIVMGHYIRGSRRIVPVTECPVHDARGNGMAFAFRDAFVHGGVDGMLRGIAIRVGAGTDEMMATLIARGSPDKPLRAATRRAMDDFPDASLHLNIHPGRDPYIFGRDTRAIARQRRMREEVGGTSFLISPTAFFQTNVRAAGILVRLVMAEVPQQARVLDLYAGTGLFALPLARAGCDVVAVEENGVAVADGEASLRLNRIDPRRCRFVRQSVEAALDSGELTHFSRSRTTEAVRHRGKTGEILLETSVSRRLGGYVDIKNAVKPSGYRSHRAEWDVVILDPPREGCEVGVIRSVFGRLRPRRAIYVSCNPEALARDLAVVAEHGYTIQSLQPVDMFPHTAHIETVAVLMRP